MPPSRFIDRACEKAQALFSKLCELAERSVPSDDTSAARRRAIAAFARATDELLAACSTRAFDPCRSNFGLLQSPIG